MSLALYRKYRSRTLDEIVGQAHVTSLLSQAISQGRIAHAYLFTGPRGVGKTSIARILAHQLNDLPYDGTTNHLDIIEIDAASNNGVEDIRDLRERVQIAPVSAKKKVYIIDEVHMLSKPAFNALLKTLEEPPEHVVFILATTDVDKVPETILSRTQRHSFKRATTKDIIENLTRIAAAENITAEQAALELIAHHADGSFRDSVSLFDQLRSGLGKDSAITVEHVRSSLGLATFDEINALLDAVTTGDIASITRGLDDMTANGISARIISSQLSDVIRRRMISEPHFLPLLDSLIDVHQSAYPELKLLTTLGMFSAPTTPPHVSVAQSHPMARTSAPKAAAPKIKPQQKSKPAAAAVSPESPEDNIEKPPKKKVAGSKSFDWDTFIAHVKAHHVAIHSVLCKCEPEIDGGTLILYTRTAFYKKKLDDSKYRVLLNTSMEELGYGHIEIETRPTTKPLKDSDAAKVAAIMGGGEEVGLEEDE